MTYYDYLCRLLEPMRVYRTERGTLSGGELYAAGKALDKADGATEYAEQEGVLQTAEQGWTMQEITDAATAALQAYFTGERLGEAVYTAKLASILYGVEGVKNCHLLTPDEDVSVSATELPVLGTVTITEIGAGEA